MKNITKSILALFAVVAFSCSVEDVQDRPVVEGVDAPVLTAPTSGAAYVLTPEKATSQADRFTWTSANFGGDVQVNYVVQMDKKGNEFKTAQVIGSALPSSNQVAVTVEAMNGAALTLKAVPFAPAEMEVRIKATVGATEMFSNVIGIVVTPYTTESPKLYVIGSFLNASGYGADWTLGANLPALAASGYGKVDFEGYVYFNDANSQYKFLPKNSTFDGDYGNATGPDGTFTGLLLQTGESNAGLPAPKVAGFYRLNVDTEKLTYAATAIQWGVIGSATAAVTGGDGWANDANMTYNKTTKLWSITMNLSADEFKFRANDAWSIDLGSFDSGKPGVGADMSYGGKNIKVPSAGNYTITLDLSSPRNYKYTLTKN